MILLYLFPKSEKKVVNNFTTCSIKIITHILCEFYFIKYPISLIDMGFFMLESFKLTFLFMNFTKLFIISSNTSCLILLIFENNNNIYIKDSLDTITIKRLKALVLQMILQFVFYGFTKIFFMIQWL